MQARESLKPPIFFGPLGWERRPVNVPASFRLPNGIELVAQVTHYRSLFGRSWISTDQCGDFPHHPKCGLEGRTRVSLLSYILFTMDTCCIKSESSHPITAFISFPSSSHRSLNSCQIELLDFLFTFLTRRLSKLCPPTKWLFVAGHKLH